MIRQTPEHLVLIHRPILLGAALAIGALVLMAFGLWHIIGGAWVKASVALVAAAALAGPALWFGTERIEVVFDAPRGQCTIETRRLNGTQHETIKLDQITQAALDTHKSPGHGAGAHRVALVLSPGHRPLTAGYTGNRSAKDLEARINGWLETIRA